MSVGYLSKSMAEQVNNQKKTINDLLDLVDDLLPVLKIDKAGEARVRGDADLLAADLKSMIPEAGAMGLELSVRSGHRKLSVRSGARHKSLDSSKPLGLLDHVGGILLGLVARLKKSPKDMN